MRLRKSVLSAAGKRKGFPAVDAAFYLADVDEMNAAVALPASSETETSTSEVE
jgi:hypothetical protein